MFRRLTAITGAVLFAAVVVTLTSRHTRHAPPLHPTNAQEAEARRRMQAIERDIASYRRIETDLQTELASHADAINLDKAQRLRDVWHNKAVRHQDELRRMLNSRAADQTALMQAYNILPTFLIAVDSGAPPTFAQQDPYLAVKTTPVDAALSLLITSSLQHKPQMTSSAVLQDFRDYHDIRLARSLNSPTEYTLWASGRITENAVRYHYNIRGDKLKPNDKIIRVAGAISPDGDIRVTRQICPPYEELTR